MLLIVSILIYILLDTNAKDFNYVLDNIDRALNTGAKSKIILN